MVVNVKSLISEVASRQAETRRWAFDAYKRLAVALDSGEGKPSLAEVEKVLADAGRTPEQLEADVAKLARARKLQAAIEAGKPADIHNARQALNHRYQQCQDELQEKVVAAQSVWAQAMAQIENERNKLTDLENESHVAHRDLASCEIV